MTRMRKRLLEDFIIPALNDGRYMNKMWWIKQEEGIFRIFWAHKNAARWSEDDTIVFQDWDKLKGHYKPNDTGYYMSAKQRFRAALYKLNDHVKYHGSPDKLHRDYRLVSVRRRRENVVRPRPRVHKTNNQAAIPTSVIRENTSYVARPISEEQKPQDPEQERIFAQYGTSMRKILNHPRPFESKPNVTSQQSPREAQDPSVLRENSLIQKTPHIPPQPIPVYAFKHVMSRSHDALMCPEIYVSKIYRGPENEPQTRDDNQHSLYPDDVSSGILNLSLRSDASNTPPSR